MSVENYRRCLNCDKLSHIKAGPYCRHCGASFIVIETKNKAEPTKHKPQLPSSFPAQKVNKHLWLEYNDADGKNTERAVDIESLYRFKGTTYLSGTCHLRSDTRTFRTDRIITATDPQTGEIIADIAAYLLPDGAIGGESQSKVLPVLGIIGSVALFIKAMAQLVMLAIISWLMYSCFWSGGG